MTNTAPAQSSTPGWKTTEFWLSLLAAVVGALLTSGLIADGSQLAKILGVAMTVLAALGYTWSRTSVKNTNAVVVGDTERARSRNGQGGFVDPFVMRGIAVFGVAFVLVLVGCGWLKSESKAVASSLVDCTKGEIVKTVGEMGPVFDVVLSQAIDDDHKVHWGPVVDLTKRFTADVGGCVLADAVARALAPPSSDPNAPNVSDVVVDKDSLREGFRSLAARQFGGATFKTANGEI